MRSPLIPGLLSREKVNEKAAPVPLEGESERESGTRSRFSRQGFSVIQLPRGIAFFVYFFLLFTNKCSQMYVLYDILSV